ncbi:stage II sporulation protein M [Saccharibacillus alkalitolerans]|uniref:Stage II sporulation protein M n=1 Tax=Saccharibacillus alkalitolerans TaxID=2705290 RepID=A0ABX0FCC1_9BACL|nr:stage II sporulation protein M [Saccharibacillus alkalitolerans]NGZ78040.1 stage II sporulation protein M [Saccharibacillus alkalitolerans]
MKILSFRQFIKGLGRNKGYMLSAALLFIVGIGAGALWADDLQRLLLSQLDGLKAVSQSLEESDNVELSFFTFIFLNNAIKAVIVMLLGAFFGLAPLGFLLLNGMVLGFVVEVSHRQGQDLAVLIFKGLLPHGIIELPAIVIVCGYGLKFGGLVVSSLFNLGEGKRERLSARWEQGMKEMLGAAVWIVILLFVAAIIESTLTYHLLR